MKLKKFIKPLVTVSALSMLLMGCAEDSSTNNGGSTTPPTVEGIFANIAQEINGHQADITDLVFKDDATAAKDVKSNATNEDKLYFVALDGVINDLATIMNTNHKAGDKLTNGGTTTELTGTAEGAEATTLTNIGTSTVLELDSETKNVTFTRTAAVADATPIGIPGGVFAILNVDEVIALDAAIAAAKAPAEESGTAEGEGKAGEAGGAAEETPVSNMTAEELQAIYNILTGKFYTVKYEVQNAQTALADFIAKNTEAATVISVEIDTTKAGGANQDAMALLDLGTALNAADEILFLDRVINNINGTSNDVVDADVHNTNGAANVEATGISNITNLSGATALKVTAVTTQTTAPIKLATDGGTGSLGDAATGKAYAVILSSTEAGNLGLDSTVTVSTFDEVTALTAKLGSKLVIINYTIKKAAGI